MSYERRLEIEALPAETGWGKWQGVIGHGTELVERRDPTESELWIARPTGPYLITVNRYEYWQFAENKRPVDKHWINYTQWHNNYDYTNYSLKEESRLGGICGQTREEVAKKVCALMEKELTELRKAVTAKEEILKAYQQWQV